MSSLAVVVLRQQRQKGDLDAALRYVPTLRRFPRRQEAVKGLDAAVFMWS